MTAWTAMIHIQALFFVARTRIDTAFNIFELPIFSVAVHQTLPLNIIAQMHFPRSDLLA